MTFEYEEGVNRANNYNNVAAKLPEFSHYKKLLGEDIEILETPQPSDIIWENRYFSNT